MAKSKKTEFPYRKSDDKALEEGQQVARSRYHREVDAAARALLEDMDKGLSSDDLDEAIQQRIYEDTDSAVIYTRDALEIVMLSDSWLAADDAAEEGLFEWSSVDGVTTAITQIAYFAYKRDLERQVEAHKSDYFGDSTEENPARSLSDRFKAHGYMFGRTGGSCTAFIKVEPDGSEIWVTLADPQGYPDPLVPTQTSDTIVAGTYPIGKNGQPVEQYTRDWHGTAGEYLAILDAGKKPPTKKAED